jgi:hypothetical protein
MPCGFTTHPEDRIEVRVPETNVEISKFIRGLTEAGSSRRASAAAEIFRQGRDLAESAARVWFADAELAGCFSLDASGFPDATVGVAVEPATFESIRSANGSPHLAEVPPDQDATEFELHFPGAIHLDILSTRQPGGPGAISRHLQKFGESIQQVELLAKDVDRATEILRSRFAIAPIYPGTRPGADGTRVNFFLVPTSNGKKVLVELVELS